MAADEPFRRRIAAILIGDVSGYSTLVGEDDERTARAVEELQSVVRDIVAEAQGRADARAGDAIFASFDSVVAAVQAALAIQRRVAAAGFAGQRLQVRIGIHFGDVLLRDGTTIGEGVGDAINVAARLQAIARPGTICISESVYLQVHARIDEPFIDLGNQQFKSIPYAVRAYLLVPREHAQEHLRARQRVRLAWAVAALALIVAAAAGWWWQQRPTTGRVADGADGHDASNATAPEPVGTATDNAQIAIGVMVFKSLGAATDDWRLEALRDGLNAQLSRLSRVKVYSKEFLDFLITRKGLSEIEAAEQLGITKMLSGSIARSQGTIRIETHVVDVRSGVLESSQSTVGREDEFPSLQTRFVLDVIANLDLPVTAAERQQLTVQRTTDERALQMLLDAERGGSAPPPAGGDHRDDESALPQWFAELHRFAVGVAMADEAGDRTAVLATIERYRHALETRDLDAVASVYTDFGAEQRDAQRRYFDNVRDLHVAIENPDVAVVGDEAVVSYTRSDTFVDTRTGREMHATVRLTKVLRRVASEWKMVAGR